MRCQRPISRSDFLRKEEAPDHRRIEIDPYLIDGVAIEMDDAAISVVDSNYVLCLRQGVTFNHSPKILNEQMPDYELGSVQQNPDKLR